MGRGCGDDRAPFLILSLGLALAILLFAQGAGAQGPCDRREKVLSLLAQRYHEAPVALGVTSEGSLLEVLADAKGSTWTIIVTSPQGLSCLILSGEGWRPLVLAAEDPEA